MTQSNPKPTLEERAAALARLISIVQTTTPRDTQYGLIRKEILAFAQAVAAESAPRWIPMMVANPPVGERVLCAIHGGNHPVIGWLKEVDGFTYWEGDAYLKLVTHWQPIPEVPHG